MIDCKRAAGHLAGLIAVGLLLSGCSGGGETAGNDSPTSAPVTASSTVVTGAASKGPIAGANVSLFELDAFGFPATEPAATTTTDSAGNFSVTLPAESSGSFLVETSGGSFVDESDQETNVELKRRIQLRQGEGLWSVISAGQTTVAITPFTDALVERARLEGSVSGDFEARLDSLRALLSDEVGFDVFTTIPADPLSPATSATAAQKQYALLLGGIANVINNVSIQLGLAAPDFEVIRAVVQDLIDGRIDGRRFNERVEVYLDDTIADLPDNVDFDLELNRFRNNNFVSFEGTELPVINSGGLDNIAPFALAGDDQALPQGSSVQLSAAASVDLDGGIASYAWVQTSGPEVQLAGASTATASFLLPASMIGQLTLVFELTVTDSNGASASDSVTVFATPALSNQVFVVDERDVPFQFGRDLDPGGGLLTFETDGTGTLVDQDGTTVFDWNAVGLVATLDFSRAGGYVIDEYSTFSLQDTTGRQDELRVTETISSFVLTVIEDNAVRDLLSLREIGTRTTVNVTAETPAETEEIDDTDAIVGYDLTLAQSAWAIPVGQVRSLLTNVSSAIPTLTAAPQLELDRVTLGDEGGGSAFEKGESFTWSIAADGHLRIVFEGGDVGDYYLLNTRPSGDVVAVVYTYADGVKRVGVELSFVKDPDDVWNPSTLGGVYLSRGSTELEDGSRVSDDVNYRLNPDGTGLLEFDFIDTSTGEKSPVNSQLGICWSVLNDELIVKRSFSQGLLFPGSVQPTPGYCEALMTDDIRFQREQYLYDIDGNIFKTVIRQRNSDCDSSSDEECSLPITEYTPRLFEKTQSFSNAPPLPSPDYAIATGLTPVMIPVLDNDSDDGEINVASVEIVGAPRAGTASVDSTTGMITFTPDGSGQPGVLFYRVSDLDENRSTYARVDVAVDLPVAIAADQAVEQGALVTLDGSASTDNSSIVSYQWTPVSGIGVGLNDPTSQTPSFTAPTLTNLVDAETLVFELRVTDDVGQTGMTEVIVAINPRLTTELVLVDDLFIEQRDPLAFFGAVLDTGDTITLNPNGTGTLIAPSGSGSFNWMVDGDLLSLDFAPYGGFIPEERVYFQDLNGDTIQEEVRETVIPELLELTLIENGAGVDLVDLRIHDSVTIFNITDNALVSQEMEIEQFNTRVFDARRQIPFVISDGETRALMSNVSTNNELLRNAPEAVVDEFTFDAMGTGFARFKNQSFSWTIEDDGHLNVQFADGESADFFHRKETRAGDFVTSLYHYNDETTRAFANLMYRDNRDFDVRTVPGIYLQYNPIRLDDGSVYYERAWRSARPDGTGQGEFESIDPVTGEVTIAASARGICWSLEADDDLYFKRTPSVGQRYSGSRTPDPSTCDGLSDFDVAFGRIYNLYDALPETVSRYGEEVEQLQIVARNLIDTECDCSEPLGVDDQFPVLFEFIPFNGNPGFAVNDDVDVDQGVPTVIDILSNDLGGDFAIDPASVIIELAPIDGTVAVDPTTGDLTYTSDLGVADDIIYYRFKDVNGNLSNLGTVIINIDLAPPVAIVNVDRSAQQGALVTLDGSSSFDNSEIVSYQWTQVGGGEVVLSDPTAPSPTFSAPSFENLTDADVLIFELAVTDNFEQTDVAEVLVDIEPSLPLEFVIVDDLFLDQRDPLAFLGDIFDTGERASLGSGGDGTFIAGNGRGTFNWTGVGDVLTLDFSAYDDLPPDVIVSFFDIDDDEIEEEITETRVANTVQMTLVEDGNGSDLVDLVADATLTTFNVTDNVQISQEPDVEAFTTRIFDNRNQIPFSFSGEESRLLLSNASTENPRLENAPELVADELMFNTNGSGFARFKNQPFGWQLEEDGHLVVSFADGEIGEFYHRKDTVGGEFVTSLYHYTDGATRSSAALMYRDNLDFDASTLPGIYINYNPLVLEDDTVYYQRVWRYWRPDGTGQLEVETVDPATGVATINVIGAGLCVNLDPANNDVYTTLSVAIGQRYAGSRTPSTGHCAALVNSQVITGSIGGGIFSLYDKLPETVVRYGEARDQLQVMLRTRVNDCACDDPLEVFSHVSGVLEFIPFDRTPGFAVDDSVDAIPGTPIIINILANDIAGDAAIDPSSIIIELDPNGGSYTVNPATGEITYTPDDVIYDDVIYYRFKDVNGNLSTLGTIDIAVGTNLA